MSTAVTETPTIPLKSIALGENVREIDEEFVKTLAESIKLRGLVVPLVVRPDGEGYTLVAGHHRYAACKRLKLDDVPITFRDREGSSGDTAAENVVRKQLTPLEEARAVQNMLDEGYTLEGAAQVLGWSQQLVKARATILGLPEKAQQLIGTGEIPVGAVPLLVQINELSPALCEAIVVPILKNEVSGSQLANNPGWALSHALRSSNGKAFGAFLQQLGEHDISELRLGKKAETEYAEAAELNKQLQRYAYQGPTILFAVTDVDQARAAGVLIELEDVAPIIIDRTLYRELAKQVITRTLAEMKAAIERKAEERAERKKTGQAEPTPQQELESEHRAEGRAHVASAHATNLDLGASLLQNLATVDPNELDVARFFVYGLLGAQGRDVTQIAAKGIRLVFDKHRTTTTPTLKSGADGKTKVEYHDPSEAVAWLWKWLDGARDAGELYGRALVVYAAQHYALDIVLPKSEQRPSLLPWSQNDIAEKSFERVTRKAVPATHKALLKAIAAEAREFQKRQQELAQATNSGASE